MGSTKKIFVLGSAFLLASGAVNAHADCAGVLSSYPWAVANDPVLAAELVSDHPECFGGSSTTSQTQISSTSFQQVAAISAALASRTLGSFPVEGSQARLETKSMAAGGKNALWNSWASGNISDTDQDYISLSGAAVKTDTDIRSAIFGVDYSLSPKMTLGLSVLFDEGDGLRGTSNSFETGGYVIAPYFGVQLNNELAFDVSVGLGEGEIETVNTSADARRLFAAVNMSYSKWVGNAQLTGKVGFLHGEEKYDDTESNGVTVAETGAKNKLDQFRGGVQAGYWMDGVMPYVGLTYSDDINRSTTQIGSDDPIGNEAWIWTLGVNFVSTKTGLTAGLAYSQDEGRSNQSNDIIMANLNYRF